MRRKSFAVLPTPAFGRPSLAIAGLLVPIIPDQMSSDTSRQTLSVNFSKFHSSLHFHVQIPAFSQVALINKHDDNDDDDMMTIGVSSSRSSS